MSASRNVSLPAGLSGEHPLEGGTDTHSNHRPSPLSRHRMTDMKMIVLCVAAIMCACSSDDSNKPYLEFAGGGFIFNYRLATTNYGFVARRVRKIPRGTIIEAEF